VLGLAWDLPEALCVWVFSGPVNSDADFERYLASIKRLDESCKGREFPAGILVSDAGNPPPNAAWRRRIAEETRRFTSRPLFALVSTSVIVRGVVTAINWIRPPSYDFASFDTFDAAVAWVESRRGRKVAIASKLLAEARTSLDGA
jgi:hypothetical protein